MTITTDGMLQIAKGVLKNVEVVDIGETTGWMVGELFFKVKEVRLDRVLVEFGVQDPETKRPLALQESVWVYVGGQAFCENNGEAIFFAAQLIRNTTG